MKNKEVRKHEIWCVCDVFAGKLKEIKNMALSLKVGTKYLRQFAEDSNTSLVTKQKYWHWATHEETFTTKLNLGENPPGEQSSITDHQAKSSSMEETHLGSKDHDWPTSWEIK